MSALADLQRDFQGHVMHGHERVMDAIRGTPLVPASVRLGIYSEAYRLRLIDALGATFPRLQELLGKQQFADVACEYIDLSPSTYPSIRWFGDRMPVLLEKTFADQPWLAELARWEWSIAAAFDAADAEALGVEALGAVSPEDWATLLFHFDASVQVVEVRTNAPVLFKALSDEETPPAGTALDEPQSWLIWRHSLKTQYRSLGADEAAALRAVLAGGTFEALCESLCDWHEVETVPLQAAGMLKRWVMEQMIVGLAVS